MNHVEPAYQSGFAEAQRDIAEGRLRLHYGARGTWGQDLAETLRSRFGVELRVVSCLGTDESRSFEAGYNCAMEAFINNQWGAGSVATVLADVQRRRQEASERWLASQKPA